MWLVKYAPDVEAYLDTSGWIVLNLNRELIRLAFTDDGIPTEGNLFHYGDGLYWWIVAGHSLILEHTENTTYIYDVYAGELRDTVEIEKKLAPYRQSDTE